MVLGLLKTATREGTDLQIGVAGAHVTQNGEKISWILSTGKCSNS